MKDKPEPKEPKLSAMAVDCCLDPPNPTDDVEAIELLTSNTSKRNRGIEHAKRLLGKKPARLLPCH
jgi:hypothetical protein